MNNQNEEFKAFCDHLYSSMFDIIFTSPLMPYVDQRDKERFAFHHALIAALTTNVCWSLVKGYSAEFAEYGSNYFEQLNKKNAQFYNYIKGTRAQKEFENTLQNLGPIFIDRWKKDYANQMEQKKVESSRTEIDNATNQFTSYESKLFPSIYGCKEFLDFLKRNKIKDVNGAILTIMNLFIYSIYKNSKSQKHIILMNVCNEQTLKERERFLQEINKTPKVEKDFKETCIVVINKLNKWFKFVKK